MRIKLPKGVWSYDPQKPLGPPGGFGAVFEGTDTDGRPVAVKRLHVGAQQAAHRELTIAGDLADRQLDYVLPILDAGQDAVSGEYYVVMPIADGSLQDRLRDRGPVPEPEAVEILLQIVAGLESVHHIVHRDLKPGNMLLYEGHWCIADFGIARFVEESTSTGTLKDCLSPQYAAPEQWRLEHATSATDIYALGCIGYALLTGAPPFDGTVADLQDQHLSSAPPDIPAARPQMKTLLAMMLRKPKAARPGLPRVKTILENVLQGAKNEHNDHLDRLASAAARYEAERARTDAEAQAREDAANQRTELAEAARRILAEIFEELARRITERVPNAQVHQRSTSRIIDVGSATLEIDWGASPATYAADAFRRSAWDVVAGAAMQVVQANPRHQRGASLWYTKRDHKEADYRWYEVGYEGNPLTRKGFRFEPTAVTPELADRAHSKAMDVIQASYPPIPIDDEDVDSFCRRWARILAEASNGNLGKLPGHLPPGS